MVSGLLAKRFSGRTLVMAGIILSTIGLVTSSMATSVPYLYFSYGITTGAYNTPFLSHVRHLPMFCVAVKLSTETMPQTVVMALVDRKP